MHGRILKRMGELVRRRRYVMTTHADEEADEDGLSVLDIESVILTGAIVERQRDRETHEWKYVSPWPDARGAGRLRGCKVRAGWQPIYSDRL